MGAADPRGLPPGSFLPYSGRMTKMQFLSRLWTDAVAYVALLVGSGLSIAGNVADTYRTRGPAADTLDIVMAVAWPALVVLMIEIFVSRRWDGLPWPMQILRWAGTLAIGGMAMRVSWVHLNDLMASRGQEKDVAAIGPLAIDALAIMATALILAGRKNVATAELATSTVATPLALADVMDMDNQRVIDTMASDVVAKGAAAGLDIDLDATVAKYGIPTADEMARALDMLEDVANEDVAKPTTRRGARAFSPADEDEIVTLAGVGILHIPGNGLTVAEIDRMLAVHYGGDESKARSVRRLRERHGVRPVSGPPAS